MKVGANQKPYKLNLPPTTFIRVGHEDLRAFVEAVARRAGLAKKRSTELSVYLIANDLRGVHSHGSRLIAEYARELRRGVLNADPDVHVVRESAVSLIMDGDGGLGYFPAADGTKLAISKARKHGMAVMQSRNHGHIGAAGLYARMTLNHDLITFVTSGSPPKLPPGGPVYSPAIGSPMCFSAPAGENDPLVVDFSPVYDLRVSPHWTEIAHWIPGTVFRCIGLGTVAQAWGGLLAGISPDPSRNVPAFSAANQAALVLTVQIALFTDPAEFRREMDNFARRVAALAPLDGFLKSQFAGGPEADHDREYRKDGIPIGPEHQTDLETIANELGITAPW